MCTGVASQAVISGTRATKGKPLHATLSGFTSYLQHSFTIIIHHHHHHCVAQITHSEMPCSLAW